MPLRVFHQGHRVIEAHRLVVEESADESRVVMGAQVRARIGEEREARRMRFRKAIERERGDRFHDLVLHRPLDAVPPHSRAQLGLDLGHAFLGALEAHGATQLLGLASGETGDGHGHAQKLFLEQRHAQRPFQNGLKRRVRILHGLPARASIEIGMNHLPDDRAGPDDRHLDHEVVEVIRLHPRQGRHLGAAFHLEHAHGVGRAQHRVRLRIVGRQTGDIDLNPGARKNRDRVLQRRHHAETEQVDLDDAEVGAVFLVPLDDGAARHRRGLERHHLIEPALGHDHAARVLAEMTRKILNVVEEAGEDLEPQVRAIDARAFETRVERVLRVVPLETAHLARDVVDHVVGQFQHLADLA